MEIKIEELRIGDQILVLSQVPKLLTVLELPAIKGPCRWRPYLTLHKTIRCRNNAKIVKTPANVWDSVQRKYVPGFRNIKTNFLESCEPGEGETKKFDLNFKKLWKIN
jgi:hypothetical protein